MKLLFLPNSFNSPSSRFRLWQFVDPLRHLGHTVSVRVTKPTRDWDPSVRNAFLNQAASRLGSIHRLLSALWITRDVEKFDIVFMNRDLIPNIHIRWLEPWLCRRNPRFIFDFDDAIHVGSRGQKLCQILPHFALITPGNPYLAEFAGKLNSNVEIWPTVVDTNSYQPASQRQPGPIRIGWTGSKSTRHYCLPLLENVIKIFASQRDMEFIVIADVDPALDWEGVRTRFIPWSSQTEVNDLQQIDIGLMPLSDTPFERGKCGLKAILYMGIGVPALVSPIGVNRDIVLHGKTGFHCKDDRQWLDYLKTLADDKALREKMGKAGRERVIAGYSLQSLLPRMLGSFERIANIGSL